jgi:acyl-CoA thioesterase
MTTTASPTATTSAAPSLTDVLAGPEVPGGPLVLDRSWWSWAGPHGGLLAAVALHAGRALAGAGRTPRSLSAQFLRTVDDGQVRPETHLVREGGASSTVSSVLRGSDGGVVLSSVLTSGRSRGGGEPYGVVDPPRVPPVEDCTPLALPVELVPYGQHFEHRPAAGSLPFAGGERAELVAWVRLRADDPLDSAALTVLVDAMPPALYGVVREPVVVPTVDLTVSYAAGLDEAPLRGWVLVRIATRTAAAGWCVDDSEVWSPDGALLVQARQTRRVLGELTR